MNANLPLGAEYLPDAPYNQREEDLDFNVVAGYTIAARESVTVNVPVEYDECDGRDYPITSDVDWREAFESQFYTPMQLIKKLQEFLEREINEEKHREKPNRHRINALDNFLQSCRIYYTDDINIEQI